MLIHFTWRLSRFAGLAVGCVFILTAVHTDNLLYLIRHKVKITIHKLPIHSTTTLSKSLS